MYEGRSESTLIGLTKPLTTPLASHSQANGPEVEVARTFSRVKDMYQIDLTPALFAVEQQLAALPFAAKIAVLAVSIWFVSAFTKELVKEVQAGRLNVSTLALSAALFAVAGWHFGGVPLAVWAAGLSLSLVMVAMCVRKTIWEIQVRLNHDKAHAEQSK